MSDKPTDGVLRPWVELGEISVHLERHVVLVAHLIAETG